MKSLKSNLQILSQSIGGEIVSYPKSWRDGDLPLGRIVTDSRDVGSGDTFWTLIGPNHDAADFIDLAIQRGATGIVTHRAVQLPENCWCIRVTEPGEALIRWASAIRQQFDRPVIGVTGSVGKTTTRSMIDCVLSSRYNGLQSPKNYNNRIGLPLSLVKLQSSHDYAVLEMGADALGQIAELAEIARPTIGVITGIADAHLERFGSRENIVRAKCELLDAMRPGSPVVLDNAPRLIQHAKRHGLKITTFGVAPDCDVQADRVRIFGRYLTFDSLGHEFRVPVVGRHFVKSALAAIAVGRLLGVAVAEMVEALLHYQPVAMRCELKQIGQLSVINDAYNANPTSVRAAIDLQNDLPFDIHETSGRRVTVLGDMRELGPESDALHREVGRYWSQRSQADDLLITVGESARCIADGASREKRDECENVIAARSIEEVNEHLRCILKPGDRLLIKASRAMQLERIVHCLESQNKTKRPSISISGSCLPDCGIQQH